MTGPLRSVWRSIKSHGGLFLIAAIAAVAVFGVALPGVPLRRLALIVPAAHIVAVLADAATAYVLFAMVRTSQFRRSKFVLALSYVVSAVLALMATLSLPLMPNVLSVLPASPNTGVWLYVSWHITAALGALAYVALHATDSAEMPPRRFTVPVCVIAVSVLVGFLVRIEGFPGSLPVISTTASLGGMVSTGVGPLTVVLLALAALSVFRLSTPTMIERALALSLVAFGFDTFMLLVDKQRYTVDFYAGRVLLLVGATAVLVAAVRSLVTARTRMREIEKVLTVVESESAKRAERIRALWDMASHITLTDREGSQTVLQIAAESLRPNKGMCAYVSHLEGASVVVDAVSWLTSDIPEEGLAELIFPGAVLPLERTILSLVHASGRTLAWDDLVDIERRGMYWEKLGWRSVIASTIHVNDRDYFAIFFSLDVMHDEPFAEDDIAYVDVVTSFFANRVTQQVQFDQLQFAIEHDALTGLGNRVHFRQAVRDEIRASRPFTIAFANVDGFRRLNEREGHSIGDEILVEVGNGLSAVDAGNLVARMSGDEFGLLLRGCGTLAEATNGLDRYSRVFATPFHGGALEEAHTIRIGASMGAARSPEDGDTVEELMRRAGVALDIAKTRGGSTVMVFDGPMESILDNERLRVVEIADAIARDHFALVYQPTFSLETREITGAEALIRWDHPERGRLPPSEFIGFAERNGMIGALSRWVVRRLLRDLDGANLPPGFRVYFNLAAQMLDDIPFIAELSESLRTSPALIEHLGIEMTETAAMQNVERSMHTIDLLRRWGFSVAIDDFGTGYSSLSYLKRLTVDMIKIDRSFIIGIPSDERDNALTEMLLRITDRFGFATLAEGIETEAQADWLTEHGCRFGQGFLVARPESFEALMQRLRVAPKRTVAPRRAIRSA